MIRRCISTLAWCLLPASMLSSLAGCDAAPEARRATGSAAPARATPPGTTSRPSTSSAAAASGASPQSDQRAGPPSAVIIPAQVHSIGTAARSKFDGIPRKTVRLGALAMDRTEVTVQAYEACVAGGTCTAPVLATACNYGRADRTAHPVNCVTRRQAEAYCAWAGRRLPTEEEWEAAASWAAAREPEAEEQEDCLRGMQGGGTCPVHESASTVLPGWCDNVAEWVAGVFCHEQAPICHEGIVKGRSFRNTVSEGTRVRFLPPARGHHRGRRSAAEIGFRCIGDSHR